MISVEVNMSDSNEQNPVSNSPNKKVGMFFLIGLIVMPYIFAWFTLQKGYSKTTRFFAFFGWPIVFLIAAIAGPNYMKYKEKAEIAKQAKAAKEPVTYISDSCQKVSKLFGAESPLSSLQKEELWKEYKNKNFKWKLIVTDVSSELVGSGFTLQFKCQGSQALIQDIQIDFPKEAKDRVLQMVKEESYVIEGKLKSYNSLVGLMSDAL